MTRKSDRQQRYEERAKKQLEEAFKYPFCRKCKKPLSKKWVAKLKADGTMPLCSVCLPIVMEQYQKNIKAWQKLKQQ